MCHLLIVHNFFSVFLSLITYWLSSGPYQRLEVEGCEVSASNEAICREQPDESLRKTVVRTVHWFSDREYDLTKLLLNFPNLREIYCHENPAGLKCRNPYEGLGTSRFVNTFNCHCRTHLRTKNEFSSHFELFESSRSELSTQQLYETMKKLDDDVIEIDPITERRFPTIPGNYEHIRPTPPINDDTDQYLFRSSTVSTPPMDVFDRESHDRYNSIVLKCMLGIFPSNVFSNDIFIDVLSSLLLFFLLAWGYTLFRNTRLKKRQKLQNEYLFALIIKFAHVRREIFRQENVFAAAQNIRRYCSRRNARTLRAVPQLLSIRKADSVFVDDNDSSNSDFPPPPPPDDDDEMITEF